MRPWRGFANVLDRRVKQLDEIEVKSVTLHRAIETDGEKK